MRDLFQNAYYLLDLAIGFGAPVLVYLLLRTGRVTPTIWRLFWVGCAIGLTWEVPMFVLSGADTGFPVLVWNRPPPVHYLVLMVSHTLWDGGLFLVGVWLVHRLNRAPVLQTFRWQELAVMLAWGQASELAVEISSTFNNAWSFIPGYWWNPTLFTVGGHPITLMPQLVWLYAPIAFYPLAVKLYAHSARKLTATVPAG